MKTKNIILGLGLILFFAGCGSGKKEANEVVVGDSVASKFISSSAAVENANDTTHKFVRTADLKFKVNSVIKSTYDIENITNQQGGFVTYTNLTSNIHNVSVIAISADSSLETTNYLVTNTITVRVPNTKLDTTLKEIARNIDFLDYRIIKADDVALSILSNNLAQKRAAKNEQRLSKAIDSKGKRLNKTTVAEEVLSSKQEQADNVKISNFSLKDQINFSTIQLSIYQRETIKREVISNDKNISAYEPEFISKFIESLKSGWEILANFILFLTKFWGLFLLVVVVYFLYNKYGNKLKK